MLNFNGREVEAESWVDTIESDFAVVDIKTLKQTCEATCMNKHLLTGKSFLFYSRLWFSSFWDIGEQHQRPQYADGMMYRW